MKTNYAPIPVDGILLGNYIKYSTLKKMNEVFHDSNADSINIYIDMYQMLLSIYRDNIIIKDYSAITSSIINLCAHLRGYYKNTHHVHTKIFIVYSTGEFEIPKKLYNGYNALNEFRIGSNMSIHKMVLDNIPLLQLLCTYLDDIYFISRPVEPAVVIYDIILKEEAAGNTAPNVILSKSPYIIQLPAVHPNTFIFKNKKIKGEELFTVVSNSNCIYDYIYTTRNEVKDNVAKILPEINTKLLSMIMAMTNLTCRNIKSLVGISKACKVLSESIEANPILNSYNGSVDALYDSFNGKLNIDKSMFLNRFKAIDIIFQHMFYLTSQFSKDNSYMINLNDPNGVKEINNKYFINNPLDLNRL